MSTEQLFDRKYDDVGDSYFQQSLPQVYRAVLQQFRRLTASFVLFNLLYLAVFAAELFFFIIFLPFLIQSTWLAISLSGLFLTIFSYFVLQFYFSAKKTEQLIQLKEQFISSCRQLTGSAEKGALHHLSIAAALTKLTSHLEDFEWQLYQLPRFLQSLNRPLASFSALCHWQDVFRFKQLLFYAAIDEHMSQIHTTPTDLEAHASLANTYLTLSKLFIEPKRSPNPSAFRKKKTSFEAHFRMIAKLAMNEFQILNHYAPNDPWVHEQLSYGYRDLSMPEEEVKEIETLLQLRPQNQELLLRLGKIYFEQGSNAQGLKIYEGLKKANHPNAEELIAIYGKLAASLPAINPAN